MAQHDMILDNAAGAAFRADANSALAALVGNSSGATEPTVKYAYQLWADTSSGLLKIRNAANNAWVSILTLSTGVIVPADTGQVLQVVHATDAGASHNGTSLSNLNAGNINITPKSTSSRLIVEVQFLGIEGFVTLTNTSASFQIRDVTASAYVGNANTLSAAVEGAGATIAAPCFLRASISNTALTVRQFTLHGSTSSGATTVSATSMVWTIIEIKV